MRDLLSTVTRPATNARPESCTTVESTNSQCPACSSPDLVEFIAEISLHFAGLARLNKGHIYVFPMVAVCLDCGTLQGTLSANDVQRIRESGQQPPTAPYDTTRS